MLKKLLIIMTVISSVSCSPVFPFTFYFDEASCRSTVVINVNGAMNTFTPGQNGYSYTFQNAQEKFLFTITDLKTEKIYATGTISNINAYSLACQ